MTLEQIAEDMGVTKQRIAQIIDVAVSKVADDDELRAYVQEVLAEEDLSMQDAFESHALYLVEDEDDLGDFWKEENND